MEITNEQRMGLSTIAAFSDPLEAHILKARLESEGVAAFVFDEHLIRMNWLYSNALGGVKVKVPEGRVEGAMSVLQGIAAGRYELDLGDDEHTLFGPAECPQCAALDFWPSRWRWTVAFLAFFLAQVPLPFRRNRWKCGSCGLTSIGSPCQSETGSCGTRSADDTDQDKKKDERR